MAMTEHSFYKIIYDCFGYACDTLSVLNDLKAKFFSDGVKILANGCSWSDCVILGILDVKRFENHCGKRWKNVFVFFLSLWQQLQFEGLILSLCYGLEFLCAHWPMRQSKGRWAALSSWAQHRRCNQQGHLSVTQCPGCKGLNTQSKLEALSSLTASVTAALTALQPMLLINYWQVFVIIMIYLHINKLIWK